MSTAPHPAIAEAAASVAAMARTSPALAAALMENAPRRVALKLAVDITGRLDSIHNADDVVATAAKFFAFLADERPTPARRGRPPKKRGVGRPRKKVKA